MERKRVLVIDDDRDALGIFGSMLTLAGYLVMYEDAGARACEAAGRFHPDAILLDLGLSAVIHEQIAATLHADPRCGAIPVIILTPDPPALNVSLSPNVRQVLLKPCAPRALLNALSTVFGEDLSE